MKPVRKRKLVEAIRRLIERVTVFHDPGGATVDLEEAITAMINLTQPLAVS